MRIATSTIYERGLAAMNQQRDAVSGTQQQLSTGLRINAPSDDPVGAAEAVRTSSALAQNSQFQKNQDAAKNLLGLADNALTTGQNLLQSARTTLVSASNGTLSNSDRASYAVALQGQLDQLVAVANSQDGNGNYLFSGYQSGTQPFSQTSTGVTYNGDSGQRALQLSATSQVPVSISGSDLFERIKTGNGVFTTAAASTNTGTAHVDVGQVADPSQLTGHSYQIVFSNAGGTPGYTVTDSTTSQTVAAPSAGVNAFQSGSAITVDGMQFTLTGTPTAGDQFMLAPSTNQSVFTSLQQAISALKTPTSSAAGTAQLTTTMSGALKNIDQSLDHVLSARAVLGARENQVEGLASSASSSDTALQAHLSTLRDVDYNQAASDLSRQTTALTAAQQSFVKIVGNSLFNYL